MCLSRTLLHAYLALSWILLPGNEAAPNAAPFPPPLRPSPRPSQYGDGSAPSHTFDPRFTVEVYDCSMPRSFTPVRTSPAYDKCDQARMPPATCQTNSSYLVLQKAVYQRTRAKRCTVRESTLPLWKLRSPDLGCANGTVVSRCSRDTTRMQGYVARTSVDRQPQWRPPVESWRHQPHFLHSGRPNRCGTK